MLEPVGDVRNDPGFHPVIDPIQEMDQGDPGPRSPHLESRFHCRVPAADHEDVLVIKRVRFLVVMQDLGEILSGYSQKVRTVESPGGHHDVPGSILFLHPGHGSCANPECAGLAVDLRDVYILTDIQPEVLHHPPVVDQGLLAAGVLLGNREWNSTHFKPVRGRKEPHVIGVVHDGAGDAPLVEEDGFHAGLLRGRSHRDATRPCSDDCDIHPFHPDGKIQICFSGHWPLTWEGRKDPIAGQCHGLCPPAIAEPGP